MYVNQNSQLPSMKQLSESTTVKPHYYTPPLPHPPVNLPSLHCQRRKRRPRSASGFYVPVCRRTNFILQLLHQPKELNFGDSRRKYSTEKRMETSKKVPVFAKAGWFNMRTIRDRKFFQSRYGRDLLDGNCPIVATTSTLKMDSKDRKVKDLFETIEGQKEVSDIMNNPKSRKGSFVPPGRHFEMKKEEKKKKMKKKKKKTKKPRKKRDEKEKEKDGKFANFYQLELFNEKSHKVNNRNRTRNQSENNVLYSSKNKPKKKKGGIERIFSHPNRKLEKKSRKPQKKRRKRKYYNKFELIRNRVRSKPEMKSEEISRTDIHSVQFAEKSMIRDVRRRNKKRLDNIEFMERVIKGNPHNYYSPD